MSATAHRDLHIGMSGEDVTALQVATDKRLRMRNQGKYLTGGHDGQFGPQTARAVSRALYVLGCTEQTVAAARVDHHGQATIGAQRIIRHPEIRSHVQRERARVRLHEIRDTTIHPAVHPPTGIKLATQAALLGLKHAPEIHYTQGSLRWQGIADQLLARDGHFPDYADCSAFHSWCMWQFLGGGPDVLNGAFWKGGYTGTLLAHGRRIGTPMVEGAAVLYGYPGSTGKHVAYSLGDGTVISHGSEGGPYHLPWNYRSDVMEIRVYA